MAGHTSRYGFAVRVPLPYQAAVERTREELAKEGFGVLTEIDVAATLKSKLDVDVRPYVILGACNAPLAHRALVAEPDIGVLLPCNVVVRAGDAEGTSDVLAMDPEAALSLADNPGIGPVAADVASACAACLTPWRGPDPCSHPNPESIMPSLQKDLITQRNRGAEMKLFSVALLLCVPMLLPEAGMKPAARDAAGLTDPLIYHTVV